MVTEQRLLSRELPVFLIQTGKAYLTPSLAVTHLYVCVSRDAPRKHKPAYIDSALDRMMGEGPLTEKSGIV